MKHFKVLAVCVVHIPTMTDRGTRLSTLYQDTVFVGDPDTDKMKFLVDAGMIEEVGKPDSMPEERPPARADSETPEPPPESGPGSSKDAWVDCAVARGMSREDAEPMSKADLIKALKGE